MDRRTFISGSSAATGGALLAAIAGAAPSEAASLAPATPPQPPSFGRVGRDFPKVCGNYGNQNYSPLRQITKRNVKQLGGAWHTNLEGGDTTNAQQSTVVAEHGVLYVQTQQQNVFAVDGRTGVVKWKTNVGTDKTNMRGVALSDDLVFTISGENNVYALDKSKGAIRWKTLLLTEDAGAENPEPCDPAN